jgi:hypothetical protein
MLRFSFLVACGALLLAVSSVRAASVSVDYYTTGSFSTGSSSNSPTFSSNATSSSVTVPDPASSGSATFTYIFGGSSTATTDISLNSNGATKALALGTFGGFEGSTTAGDSAAPSVFNGIDFTLDVWQTVPTGGPAALAAIVTGELYAHGTGNFFQVAYSPASTVVSSAPPILYTITDTFTISTPPTSTTYTGEDITTSISGVHDIGAEASVFQLDAETAPLPSAARMGLTLFGGLLAFTAVRRRFLARVDLF